MNSGVKLAIGAAVVVGVTSYMAYVGAASSWKYYVTAEECLADQSKFVGSRVRVSGTIAPGSLQVAADRSRANFSLEGNGDLLAVVCTGLLPDNLDEEMEVVVEGRLEAGGLLRGDKLLTRCASKYEPDQTGGTPAINSGKDKEWQGHNQIRATARFRLARSRWSLTVAQEDTILNVCSAEGQP